MKTFKELRESCWTGYTAKGMKKKGKRMVPNCVPVKEETDKKDTVTFDIPLLIRTLERAREDIKTDIELHQMVEKLINIRHKGVLTMDNYDEII
jgi:hypothetical protein